MIRSTAGAVCMLLALLVGGCGRPGSLDRARESEEWSTPIEAPRPGPAPTPDVSDLTFTAVELGGPPENHKSRWMSHSKEVSITPVEGGLRCTITVGPERTGYGGVRFAAASLKALRLDLRLEDPAKLHFIFVDGYDRKGRCVRWQWDLRHDTSWRTDAGPFVLVPGRSSGFFTCSELTDISNLAEIHVFVMVAPDSKTSFILRKAEIAR